MGLFEVFSSKDGATQVGEYNDLASSWVEMAGLHRLPLGSQTRAWFNDQTVNGVCRLISAAASKVDLHRGVLAVTSQWSELEAALNDLNPTLF